MCRTVPAPRQLPGLGSHGRVADCVEPARGSLEGSSSQRANGSARLFRFSPRVRTAEKGAWDHGGSPAAAAQARTARGSGCGGRAAGMSTVQWQGGRASRPRWPCGCPAQRRARAARSCPACSPACRTLCERRSGGGTGSCGETRTSTACAGGGVGEGARRWRTRGAPSPPGHEALAPGDGVLPQRRHGGRHDHLERQRRAPQPRHQHRDEHRSLEHVVERNPGTAHEQGGARAIGRAAPLTTPEPAATPLRSTAGTTAPSCGAAASAASPLAAPAARAYQNSSMASTLDSSLAATSALNVLYEPLARATTLPGAWGPREARHGKQRRRTRTTVSSQSPRTPACWREAQSAAREASALLERVTVPSLSPDCRCGICL